GPPPPAAAVQPSAASPKKRAQGGGTSGRICKLRRGDRPTLALPPGGRPPPIGSSSTRRSRSLRLARQAPKSIRKLACSGTAVCVLSLRASSQAELSLPPQSGSVITSKPRRILASGVRTSLVLTAPQLRRPALTC